MGWPVGESPASGMPAQSDAVSSQITLPAFAEKNLVLFGSSGSAAALYANPVWPPAIALHVAGASAYGVADT